MTTKYDSFTAHDPQGGHLGPDIEYNLKDIYNTKNN